MKLSNLKFWLLCQSLFTLAAVVATVINCAQITRQERWWHEAKEFGKIAGLPVSTCSPTQEHIISVFRKVRED